MKNHYSASIIVILSLVALSCAFLSSCSTPTISSEETEDLPGNSWSPAKNEEKISNSPLITKDVLRYYVFDTLHSVLYYHFNGMCYIEKGKLKWDPQMDHYTEYYSYRLSGDTLFFSNPSEIVKTYLRQTNDGSKFGGRWILLEDESEIFTPEYLNISGLSAVWEYSIKENAPVTSTDALTLMMQDIAAEQDGTRHPHQGGDTWAPDWNLMFGKFHENHLTDDELYEFCDPCEDIVRTNNSISFTRKGKSFEISLINPVHNEKKMSYPFKVTADGKSCTFLAELFDATEDECLSEQNLPDEPIEGHTYTALGKINYDDFSKCFKGLFN
jgi:hypothetical protein